MGFLAKNVIKNVNTGQTAIDAYGSESIDNNKTIYLSQVWESVVLANSGTGWYIILRDVYETDWSSESSTS